MSKPQIMEVQKNPIKAFISKNGRPPSITSCIPAIRKEYPHVKSWNFIQTDHSVLAIEQCDCICHDVDDEPCCKNCERYSNITIKVDNV